MSTATIYNQQKSAEVNVLWRGLLIWGLAAAFYCFDNLLNASPSVMKPELSQAFGTNAADLGLLSSCYLWTYGLMQIPAGLLMDKVGPRKLLTFASFLCAIGSLFFSMADSLGLALIGRLLIGGGASFAVVGCSKIASIWFPANRFALFVGLMVMVGMLGAAFNGLFVSSLVQAVGWREAMYYGTALGFTFTVLIGLLVRDEPPVPLNSDEASHVVPQLHLWESLKEVISCPQAWVASIYAGLMFVPTLAFGMMWGIPYLVEAHDFSRPEAGQLVSLIFIGWAMGGPIFGWVSDYIGRRNLPMYVANIVTLLITVLIIYNTHMPAWAMAMCMLGLGFFSSGFIIAFAVMREKNRPDVAGTAIGFINMLNTFGGAAMQLVIGKLLDVTATEQVVVNGDTIFSLNDYQNALLALPVCLALSLVMLFFLKETYCHSVYSHAKN